MPEFIAQFEKIAALDPRRRGVQFERLFYGIFEKENILLERSFFNDDGSQQIDGAIEINNRIFIIEVKWEESETLAASKLYSFLGKINSKIDGTLGVFISYNELSENFINSARAGIKQNCIIICGEDNIRPIIKGEISIKDYIWYIYQQASTRNRTFLPVSQYLSLPKKTKLQTDDSKWTDVYNVLVSDDDVGSFAVKLNANYDKIDNLPEKAVILYPILNNKRPIADKLHYLVNSIIDKDKVPFYQSLISKLKTPQWITYADEYILEKAKNLSKFDPKQADEIATKILNYLRDHDGQWEEENKASLVVDFLLDYLSEEMKRTVVQAYSAIYCDESRRSRYPQKRLAEKLLSSIPPEERWKLIENDVSKLIKQYKEEEKIFSADEHANKKYVMRKIMNKYLRIIKEAKPDNIDDRLQEIYDKA